MVKILLKYSQKGVKILPFFTRNGLFYLILFSLKSSWYRFLVCI